MHNFNHIGLRASHYWRKTTLLMTGEVTVDVVEG